MSSETDNQSVLAELEQLNDFDGSIGWRWDLRMTDEEELTGFVLKSKLFLCQYHLITLDGDQPDPIVKAAILSNKHNVIVSGIATSYNSIIRHLTFAFLKDVDGEEHVDYADGGEHLIEPLCLGNVRADMSQ